MELEPVGLESLEVALKNFIDTVRDNITSRSKTLSTTSPNSIEAWRVLHETYEKLNKGNGETAVPCTSRCLRNIDKVWIRTVRQMKHSDHFKFLSAEGKRQLSRITKAFETKEATVNRSPKAICRILQVKLNSSHLTLEKMVQELETARERRRSNHSRNSSNDLTSHYF
ncbi:hypothetical protein V500_00738 [Pseudogymnoascus sp. VKM F-4518 (FW-2643)]|nr:hypothetical protein V500_00738 [Pseudogymnoascus sp. VKM F-4518 (FW-2643)]